MVARLFHAHTIIVFAKLCHFSLVFTRGQPTLFVILATTQVFPVKGACMQFWWNIRLRQEIYNFSRLIKVSLMLQQIQHHIKTTLTFNIRFAFPPQSSLTKHRLSHVSGYGHYTAMSKWSVIVKTVRCTFNTLSILKTFKIIANLRYTVVRRLISALNHVQSYHSSVAPEPVKTNTPSSDITVITNQQQIMVKKKKTFTWARAQRLSLHSAALLWKTVQQTLLRAVHDYYINCDSGGVFRTGNVWNQSCSNGRFIFNAHLFTCTFIFPKIFTIWGGTDDMQEIHKFLALP